MASRESVAVRRATAINALVELLGVEIPRKYGNELSQVMFLESVVQNLRAVNSNDATQMTLQGLATANLDELAVVLDISPASVKKLADKAKQQLAKV